MADFFAKGNKAISGFGGDTTPHRIDFDVWNSYSEEQKTALKQQYKNIHIMNVPEATGYIDADLMTKLWENPSPTASFASQSITLASDDYDFLVVLAYHSYTNQKLVSPIIIDKNSTGGYLNFADWATNPLNSYRSISFVDATHLTISDAIRNGSATNSLLIPYQVYGFKKTLSLKFQAIAHDVKASVDYSTDEHVVGKWIDGSTLYGRTFYVSELPNNTSANIPHNISNVKLVVEYFGIGFNGSTSFTLPRTGANYIDISANETYLTIVDSGNYAGWSAYITLYYTKTS